MTSWNPGLSGQDDPAYVLASGGGGGTIYVEGSFSMLGGARGMDFGAVSAASGRATRFAPNPDENFMGDSVTVFAVGPRTVYAWGYFKRIGGKSDANGVASLDRTTGRAQRQRLDVGGTPYTAVTAGGRIFLDGDFQKVGGAAFRDGLASFDAATGALQ